MSIPPEYDHGHGDLEAGIPWTSEDAALLRFYTQASKRIKRIVRTTASITPWREAYMRARLDEIKSILEQLKDRQRVWANRELGKEYRAARTQVGKDLGIAVPPFSAIDQGALQVLVESTLVANVEALNSVVPALEQIFIAARQTILTSEQLQGQIAEGLVQGMLPRDIAKGIRRGLQTGKVPEELARTMRPDDLARLDRVAKGQLIEIRCRDGVTRHYNIDYYAKMVAKSSRSIAAAEATLRTAVNAGMDLVQISVHAGACPMCVPVQGVVYSITGNTPGFPVLTPEARTPIHPWCGHRMLPVSPEILKAEGSLENLSKFSNDPTHAVTNISDYQKVESGQSVGVPKADAIRLSNDFAVARKKAA